MKNFIQDPLKAFAVVFGLVGLIFLISSCLEPNREFEQAQETKQTIQVVNHNGKPIILETLSKENLQNGIYKLTINDSNQFIIVADYDALAIERLK